MPLADPEDAAATYEAIRPHLLDGGGPPTVVHVIEKAGGAPDKAGVEQREAYAEEVFEAFASRAETDDIEVATEVAFGTDVADTIIEVAGRLDATAIVFRSRGGSSWIDLATGRVRSKLLDRADRPVVVLPGADRSA